MPDSDETSSVPRGWGPSDDFVAPQVGPGDRLGSFVLTRLLGVGGMGAVFEGVQDSPNRAVAVKVLGGAGVDSANASRRLRQEAEIQGRLRHPGIVQIFEAGVAETARGPVAYYAMEYIPGARSLTRFAEEMGLSMRARAGLLARVCDAVEHGHRAGVVHRDLTPANILVDAEGHPRIIDFGIARAIGQGPGTLATRAGTLVGTLRYMSPEQCEADPRAIDARSDVYSLGVVLYELACGGMPYELDDLTLPQAVEVIRRTPPRAAGEANPECRGDLAAVIKKALSKERLARYQSAGELGAELDRYSRGEPVLAGREGVVTSLAIWVTSLVQRRTRLAGALVATLVALLAATLGVRAAFQWSLAAPRVESWMIRVAVPPEPLDRVRIIRFDSRDGARMESLAHDLGVRGVRGGDVRSFRRLHGKMMELLARSGVSAVGWLPQFIGDDHAQAMCDGLTTLRESGAEAWVAIPSARPDESASAPISPLISGSARVGFVTYFNTPEPGVFIIPIAADVGANEPVPSLPLGLAASARHPAQDLHLAFAGGENSVRVRATRPSKVGLDAAWLTREDQVRVFGVAPLGVDFPEQGLRSEDVAATVRVDGGRARDAARAGTREYAEVLTTDDATRRAWYAGKVVLIGDVGAPEAMRPLERGPVWVGDLYAAATDALLSSARRVVRSPSGPETDLITLGAALVGVFITWRGGVGAGIALLAALTGTAVLGSVALLRGTDFLCNPLVPTIALWGSGLTWLALRRSSGMVRVTGKGSA